MKQRRAFTLIELLVVISIIALLIGILLPALGAARRTARAMQSNTQIRGLQQGMFIYSQSNKDLYPGLDRLDADPRVASTDASRIQTYNANGLQAGSYVGARFIICLEANVFSPDYVISPFETTAEVQPWDENQTYTNATAYINSYALPRIWRSTNEMSPGRMYEWRAEANASAIAVSDRLYRNSGATISSSNADPATHYSLQQADQPGRWTGGISFNDNHTEAFQTSEIDVQLSYANVKTDGADNIFSATQVGNQNISNTADANQYNAQQIIRNADGSMFPATLE
ncbi:MAG: prepilin-type N-terminal cleavage/methylation domain-containing protein [Planctomycetota bacterium]